MRISDVVRVVENMTIAGSKKVFVASREFIDECDKEVLARKMYKDEQRAPKRKRLEELRALVAQMDKQMEEKSHA